MFVARGLHQLAVSYHGAESCVITGDICDDREAEVYAWLHELIADVRIPVDLLIGNHDDRSAIVSEFAGLHRFEGGFAQGVRDTPGARLIFLDTYLSGSDAGVLCKARLGWLHETLVGANGMPVFLFMHHPPCEIGDAVMDAIMLSNPKDLAEMVAGHDNIRHIFFGHVHRDLQLTWNGIPASCIDGISRAGPEGDLVLNARLIEFNGDKVELSSIAVT